MKILDVVKKVVLFIPSIIKYQRESKRLSKVDFFDYEELLKGEYVTPMFFNSVFIYGNYKAIENLTHRKFNFIFDYLEHGINYSDKTISVHWMGYADRFCIKNIFVFSEERAKFVKYYIQTKNLKRNIIAVGPYILGAEPFYTEEKRTELKNKYGKILLVYPAHSIDIVTANYDIQQLLAEIDRHKDSFDSVFICLHWLDMNNESRRKQYEESGHILVCNGKPSDPMFLSRQRDLMELSDMVMTNALGTHVGYAVCLNRPVYFFNQEITLKGDTTLQTEKTISIENQFKKAFGKFSFTITQEQLDLVYPIWGRWDR